MHYLHKSIHQDLIIFICQALKLPSGKIDPSLVNVSLLALCLPSATFRDSKVVYSSIGTEATLLQEVRMNSPISQGNIFQQSSCWQTQNMRKDFLQTHFLHAHTMFA